MGLAKRRVNPPLALAGSLFVRSQGIPVVPFSPVDNAPRAGVRGYPVTGYSVWAFTASMMPSATFLLVQKVAVFPSR